METIIQKVKQKIELKIGDICVLEGNKYIIVMINKNGIRLVSGNIILDNISRKKVIANLIPKT
jgi:hypothetical protein